MFGAYILSLTTGFKPEIGALLILAAGVALGFDHAYSRGILKKNVPPDMLAAAHLGISGIFTSLVVVILGKVELVNIWIYAVSGLLVLQQLFCVT